MKLIFRFYILGTWRAIRTEEQDKNGNWTQITLECSKNGRQPYIEFKNDGSFDGNSCPNTLLGSYEIYKNNRIKIEGGAISEVLSFIWTPKYEDYLMKLKSYSILSDTLTMSGDKFRIIHKSINEIHESPNQ